MYRIVALSAMLAAACGSSTATTVAPPTIPPATAPATTASTTTTMPGGAPAGYAIHGSPELGFEVALPEDWFVADLTTDDIDEIADALAADNPDLVDLLRTATSSDELVFRFWAFDLDDATDDFLTNVNVTAFPRGPFDDPQNYQDALGAQFESLGGSLISSELVDIGADGLFVEMQIPLVNAQGVDVMSNGFQLFAFTENEVVNISFSTDTPSDYADAIEVMRDTFVTR